MGKVTTSRSFGDEMVSTLAWDTRTAQTAYLAYGAAGMAKEVEHQSPTLVDRGYECMDSDSGRVKPTT